MVQSNRIIGLDVVRAVAVLSVLFCHLPFDVPLSPRATWLYQYARLLAGVYGVELFFVLSGFLIGGILLRQYHREGFYRASLWPFWVRRWFRTLPNYYLYLIVVGVYAWHAGYTVNWLKHALFLQNLFTYHVDDLYGVSWSLCIEEFMYLLLPLILLVWHHLTNKRHELAVILTVATLALVPLVLRFSLAQGLSFDNGIRKVVIFRLDAIAIGVFLAYLSIYRPKWFSHLASPAAVVVGMALVAVATLVLRPLVNDSNHIYTSRWANTLLLPTIDFALMLLVAYSATVLQLGPRLNQIFERISTRSYSLYLFHVLVILLVIKRVEPLHLSPLIHTLVLMPLCVVVSFAVAECVYRVYEQRMTGIRERWKQDPSSLLIPA